MDRGISGHLPSVEYKGKARGGREPRKLQVREIVISCRLFCSAPKQRSEQIIRRGYSEGERRRAIPRGFDGSPQRNVEGRSQTGWVLAMLRPKQETDHSPY